MKNLDSVYDYVRNLIETKRVFPGQKVAEEEIAKVLGLSRSSVRSALTKLHYEGFVEIIPNRGAFISRFSTEDAISLYNVRLHLEIGAFKEAVMNVRDSNIQKMTDLLVQQEKQLSNFSITEYAALNRQFHEEIVIASNNPFYDKFLREVYNRSTIMLIFYDASRNNQGSFDTHSRMLEALKNKDTDKGIQAIIDDNKLATGDLEILK